MYTPVVTLHSHTRTHSYRFVVSCMAVKHLASCSSNHIKFILVAQTYASIFHFFLHFCFICCFSLVRAALWRVPSTYVFVCNFLHLHLLNYYYFLFILFAYSCQALGSYVERCGAVWGGAWFASSLFG